MPINVYGADILATVTERVHTVQFIQCQLTWAANTPRGGWRPHPRS